MTANSRAAASRVDQEAIHARLANAATSFPQSGRLAPEAAAEVLARRARALERAPAPEPLADEAMHVVTFTLAGERYGIEAELVREIVRLNDFTPVPGAPPFVIGVINLRGEIVAVVDLRLLLAISAPGLVDLPRVIVVGRDAAEFGILATGVQQIVSLRSEDLLAPPEAIGRIGRELAKGVSRDALLLLDGRKLLADRRLFVNPSANAGAQPGGS